MGIKRGANNAPQAIPKAINNESKEISSVVDNNNTTGAQAIIIRRNDTADAQNKLTPKVEKRALGLESKVTTVALKLPSAPLASF